MKSRFFTSSAKALLALPLMAGLAGGCATPSDNPVALEAKPATEPLDLTGICGPGSALAGVTAPTSTDAPEILGVCTDGPFTVVFSTFKDGKAVVPEEGDVSAALAKLVVEEGGGDHWQSYLNREETPASGDWPGTTPRIQATTERGGAVTTVTEGVYALVFSTDVSNVTEPLEVKWDPDAAHRVGLEFRGSMEGKGLGNPVFTWKPATDEKVVTARAIVKDESCNECHSGLALHGGARNSTDYCVLCHNPGSIDANSGNTVDFPIMVHKIHMGKALPSVKDGGTYAIWGHKDSKHDYSTVGYPQDQRNCIKCHNPADEETPDAARWSESLEPSLCLSCHDNVSFEPGTTTHPIAVADESTCVTCHGEGLTYSVERAHRTPFSTPNNPNIPPGVPHVTFELKDVSLAGSPATMPVATFGVFLDGEAIDFGSLTYKGSAITSLPSLMVTISTPEGGLTEGGPEEINPLLDFNNFWSTSGSLGMWAQPASFGLSGLASGLTANPDGTFTTQPFQLGSVPEDARNVSVGIQGYVGVDKNTNGKTDSAERFGSKSLLVGAGTTDTPRRQIVASEKCLTCHERLSLHGGNRVDNPDLCVACHNGNATDGKRRPALASSTPDGLPERTVAFSSMIHSIHRGEDLYADNLVYYGYSGFDDFKHVRFPGNLANCETCHNPGTYDLPVAENALAVTLLTGANKTSPLDDGNVSATGAACTGCHDNPTTKAHAQASSGSVSTSLHGTENDSCVTCHGAGAGWDVGNIHATKAKE